MLNKHCALSVSVYTFWPSMVPDPAQRAGGNASQAKQVCLYTLLLSKLSHACRGFGTVRYSTPDDAQAATQIMNGAEIGGRTITVRIDRFA